MGEDYVFVLKTHRCIDLSSRNYESFGDYVKRMESSNGLKLSIIVSFEVPKEYTCFKVEDRGKALMFCLNNGDVIKKPENVLTFYEKLLMYKESR